MGIPVESERNSGMMPNAPSALPTLSCRLLSCVRWGRRKYIHGGAPLKELGNAYQPIADWPLYPLQPSWRTTSDLPSPRYGRQLMLASNEENRIAIAAGDPIRISLLENMGVFVEWALTKTQGRALGVEIHPKPSHRPTHRIATADVGKVWIDLRCQVSLFSTNSQATSWPGGGQLGVTPASQAVG